jgi:hypothetical protein
MYLSSCKGTTFFANGSKTSRKVCERLWATAIIWRFYAFISAVFIANQLERIYIQHATRCVKQPPKAKIELLTLTVEDVLPITPPRQRAKIGF